MVTLSGIGEHLVISKRNSKCRKESESTGRSTHRIRGSGSGDHLEHQQLRWLGKGQPRNALCTFTKSSVQGHSKLTVTKWKQARKKKILGNSPRNWVNSLEKAKRSEERFKNKYIWTCFQAEGARSQTCTCTSPAITESKTCTDLFCVQQLLHAAPSW